MRLPVYLAQRTSATRPQQETHALRQKKHAGCGPSFDYLVGAGEQCEWKGEAESLRRLEIDDQLHFHRLLNRKVGRFGALEDLSRERATLEIGVSQARPIAHEPARHSELAKLVDCRHRMPRRERRPALRL